MDFKKVNNYYKARDYRTPNSATTTTTTSTNNTAAATGAALSLGLEVDELTSPTAAVMASNNMYRVGGNLLLEYCYYLSCGYCLKIVKGLENI